MAGQATEIYYNTNNNDNRAESNMKKIIKGWWSLESMTAEVSLHEHRINKPQTYTYIL